MAKISYVKAWGLWSHLETVFEFSPGLTVITGPNGNGKSTLIRIIRWVALGEPTGEEFIFKLTDEKTGEVIKQAEEGKAEIGLDNGIVITKQRRKGKTTYTINTIEEPFEKAEVPQEVKEALGLRKYSFGDFETYLNFAFQMEAPFLLSETPSTGAKVLGKLAGTETVDLAIAEISKRTHKARDERRIAEKEVERINGDLLDYQDIDDIKAAISACEYLVNEADAAAIRKDQLVNMVNILEAAREAIVKLEGELVTLAIVPDLDVDLKEIEKAQQRYDTLLDLLSQLEGSIGSINELTAQLVVYEGLDAAASAITDLEAKERRLSAIISISTDYTHYSQVIISCNEVLDKLTNIDVAAADLAVYEKKSLRLGNLIQLSGEYSTVDQSVGRLNKDLEGLQHVNEAYSLLGTITGSYDRLDKLKTIQTEYANRCIVVASANTDLKLAQTALEKAQHELTAAWDAAGGICPLCDQPVASHNH